ncbi:hypothetical protein V8E36_002914, partial [Tilletia maclaganii]
KEYEAHPTGTSGSLATRRAAKVRSEAAQHYDAVANFNVVMSDIKASLTSITEAQCQAVGRAIETAYIKTDFVDKNRTPVNMHSAMACVQRIKFMLRRFEGTAFSSSTVAKLVDILLLTMLLSMFGPYPGASTLFAVSAWRSAWAADSVVAQAQDEYLSEAERVWEQIMRDLHGVDLGLIAFTLQLNIFPTMASTKSLGIGAWRLNPEVITTMLAAQGGLCMEGCGRALLFVADQRLDSSSHLELPRFIGVRQYYARGSERALDIPQFPSHDCCFRVMCGTYHPWVVGWLATTKCHLVHRIHRGKESKQKLRPGARTNIIKTEGGINMDDLDVDWIDSAADDDRLDLAGAALPTSGATPSTSAAAGPSTAVGAAPSTSAAATRSSAKRAASPPSGEVEEKKRRSGR